MQRALLQSANPQNFALVRKALHLAGREDLIGTGKHCLVPPEKPYRPRSREEGRPEKKAGRPEHRPAEKQKSAPKGGNRKGAPAPAKSGNNRKGKSKK